MAVNVPFAQPLVVSRPFDEQMFPLEASEVDVNVAAWTPKVSTIPPGPVTVMLEVAVIECDSVAMFG